MNILRHLYLSTAARSPDEPAAPESEVIEPVAEAVVEQPVEVVEEPVVEPEVQPEANALENPKPATHEDQVFRRVIAEVREEKRQERTAREAAEQRAADLQAIIERMQSGEKPEAVARPAQPPAQDDFKAAVKAQAALDRLYEDSLAVKIAGEKEFIDFNKSLEDLRLVGVTSDDFVADILAVDKANAHVIIDKLAKNLEKATSLVGMDSRRRIAELTRMADAPKTEPKPVEAPKAPAVSRAPAPKPAMSPLSAAPDVDPTTPEGDSKMSDAQWEKWYKNKYTKRA